LTCDSDSASNAFSRPIFSCRSYKPAGYWVNKYHMTLLQIRSPVPAFLTEG
jgi:hypothetical protein